MTATPTHTQPLSGRLRSATDTVKNWLMTGDISEDDWDRLGSDAGLEVDGCAVWLVDGELRSFVCCTCCGIYAERAVKL